MREYMRPEIEDQVFFDDEGRVIEYGERWSDDGPPEEAYSVERNLERFLPLLRIAQQLIEYLRVNFAVSVTETSEIDTVRNVEWRVVSLVPDNPEAAPLVFKMNEYPMLKVHFGVFHAQQYPVCSCDACDEDWSILAEQLEDHVFAVLNGQFREERDSLKPGWFNYSFNTQGWGQSSGSAEISERDIITAASARKVQQQPTSGWQPWSVRGLD